jgi:Helix-turn-helix domain
MSHAATTWALTWAPIPKPTSKGDASEAACAAVLVALADHAGPDGTGAFPAVDLLCMYTRLSERTVRKALDMLESFGTIAPCDPEVVAAKIKRADRRPNGWDLRMQLRRTDVDTETLYRRTKTTPPPLPWVGPGPDGVQPSHLVDGVQISHPEAERGASLAPDGVQISQERGADVAPEPVLEPAPTEPSDSLRSPGDAADATTADEPLDGMPTPPPPADGRTETDQAAKREVGRRAQTLVKELLDWCDTNGHGRPMQTFAVLLGIVKNALIAAQVPPHGDPTVAAGLRRVIEDKKTLSTGTLQYAVNEILVERSGGQSPRPTRPRNVHIDAETPATLARRQAW